MDVCEDGGAKFHLQFLEFFPLTQTWKNISYTYCTHKKWQNIFVLPASWIFCHSKKDEYSNAPKPESDIRIGLSAEFYMNLMYRTSKSDQGRPRYEKVILAQIVRSGAKRWC